MEPRPPRPRQQYLPPETAPATGGYQRGNLEQGMYAPQPGYSAGPPPYANDLDLVPRRDRHRQRIARNLALALLLVAAIGVAGWNVRDRFFANPPAQNIAQLAPTADPGVPVANPAASTPSGAGEAPTQAPLVNSLLATSTPTPDDTAPSREISSRETEPAAPPPTAPDPGEADEEPAGEPAPADLASLLPDATDLPVEGLALSDSGVRPLATVLGSFGTDPAVQAEAEAFLEQWGWTENVYSDFAGDATVLTPDATSVITVSIHGFADQGSASEALTYFSNVVISGQGFDEVQADPIGDEIRLLRGVGEDGTTNVAAYIVDGPLLYRIGGSSPAGDPTGPVLQLADQLISGG